MNPAPTTRPRHALRWVFGVGLVFVLVVGMALQVARRRADERWIEVLSHCEENGMGVPDSTMIGLSGPLVSGTRGGNIFQSWQRCQWTAPGLTVVLRQQRGFFGSNMDARLTGSTPFEKVAREVFAEVDVELVVEP